MYTILLLLAINPAPLASQQKDKLNLPDPITPDQALERFGRPDRVGRQLLPHRAIEQWHYGPPTNLRLTFDCPRGQPPRLIRSRRVARNES